jgi:hypothetical protein
MTGVPVGLREDMDKHLEQGHLGARPPRHPAGCIDVQGVDSAIGMLPDATVAVDHLGAGVMLRDPLVGARLGVLVPPRQALGKWPPEDVTEYRASVIERCLIRPRRLVPVAVSGRRMSYSVSPSSFHTMVSRISPSSR